MKRWMTGGGAVALTFVASTSAIAGSPPANNGCASAIEISVGEVVAFDTSEATTDGPNTSCGGIGKDIWYTFTSTFTGRVTLRTCGSTFDTIMAVYSGCGCGSFNLIKCNDQACGDQSRMSVDVEAGKCYRIRVGGFANDSGSGTLSLQSTDPFNAVAADVIISGGNSNDRLGISVAGAGEVTADDRGEIIVGAYLDDAGGSNIGSAFTFQGQDLSDLDSFDGENDGDHLGFAVAGRGDMNNDGRDDLIIGAPTNDEGGTSAGKVYVYSGANSSLLWDFTGAAAGDQLGYSVDWAGDVNNDGFDDVIVGSPFADNGGSNAGRVYVLDGEDGSVLWTINGSDPDDNHGWAVSGLGDVNDDDREDFMIGAPGFNSGGEDAGRVVVYSGRNKSVLARINGLERGDRFGEAVDGVTYDGGPLFTILIVGAPNSDSNESNSGQVRTFFRNHSTDACASYFCARFTIDGPARGDEFGTSVSVGNAFAGMTPDFLVGAPFNDAAGSKSGRAYLFNGSNGTLVATFTGEAAGDQLGKSVSITTDIDDDEVGDVLLGGPFNDANGSSAGRAYYFSSLTIDDTAGAGGPPGLTSVLDAEDEEETGTVDIDLNGDGAADSADVVALLRLWGPCEDGGCLGDLNRDGRVDVDDLAAMLLHESF